MNYVNLWRTTTKGNDEREFLHSRKFSPASLLMKNRMKYIYLHYQPKQLLSNTGTGKYKGVNTTPGSTSHCCIYVGFHQKRRMTIESIKVTKLSLWQAGFSVVVTRSGTQWRCFLYPASVLFLLNIFFTQEITWADIVLFRDILKRAPSKRRKLPTIL